MVKLSDAQLACIECDLVMTFSVEPEPGQRLACPRCEHVLARGTQNPEDTVIALSITALMALVASISFSFLSFQTNGLSNMISLVSVAKQLYASGFGLLALVVIAFMIFLPFVYLSALITLALKAKFNIRDLTSRTLANIISIISPWIMADVFIFGVLVALVKMVDMADVVLGISFWSYVIFTLVFIQITLIVDTHRLWHWVDDSE